MRTPALHSTYASSAARPARASAADFFATHPILPILRSIFLSSLLWVFLALALYGVYTLVLSLL